jgi:ATP-dependent Clp protease, protease subunit
MQPKNRLNRLLALNRGAPRAYRVEGAATDSEVTIYLYDVIGYDWWTGGGVTPTQFAKDLQAAGGRTLHLRINSPGGDVFDGRAMVAALKEYAGEVIVHVDGLAASAASFLAVHGSRIEMNAGSFMMIHNGWTLAMGDRHAMLDMAGLLEKIDSSIVDDYQKRTGADREQIAQWMDDETWMTAAEAVERGFADRIAGSTDGAAQAKAWNLAAYEKAPKALAPEENTQRDADAAHQSRLRAIPVALA